MAEKLASLKKVGGSGGSKAPIEFAVGDTAQVAIYDEDYKRTVYHASGYNQNTDGTAIRQICTSGDNYTTHIYALKAGTYRGINNLGASGDALEVTLGAGETFPYHLNGVVLPAVPRQWTVWYFG